jgi:hypothetical protein
MTRTLARRSGLWLAALLFTAAPASAQVVHSLHIGAGGFFPKGAGSRASDDVLLRNFVGEPVFFDPDLTDALFFEFKDFRTGSVFGEWNVAFGNHVEIGASVGLSRKTVPTIYVDLEDEATGVNIFQTLSLRVVPITGLVRFLPFGNAASVQPYVGAGVSALNFHYKEEGEFVDSFTAEIFNGRFRASGTAPGGVVVFGIRFPVKGDVFAITVEGRRQFGTGDLGTNLEDSNDENDFLTDKVDLGGTHFTGGVLIRF